MLEKGIVLLKIYSWVHLKGTVQLVPFFLFIISKLQPCKDEDHYWIKIKMQIWSRKNLFSPGCDGVTTRILTLLHNILLLHIRLLCQNCQRCTYCMDSKVVTPLLIGTPSKWTPSCSKGLSNAATNSMGESCIKVKTLHIILHTLCTREAWGGGVVSAGFRTKNTLYQAT
jgi:hypothetical protein